jgi:rhamnose utilization protein RhaD (predicted bifunctional aldolase and dehydrogenase)
MIHIDNQLKEKRAALLQLSHELGREERGWAILGEGNSSVRLDADRMLIKASGTSLGRLRDEDVVECTTSTLSKLLDRRSMNDEEIEEALLASRVDQSSKKPSVEALFHAHLLSLPDVQFVGHTHATAVNQILCSPGARQFADRRIFPDEIVCCGAASVFVPYTDPGLKLAQAIRTRVKKFVHDRKLLPRVVLIKNHGIIALGATKEAVLAAMQMAEKAAQIWVGAAALGGPTFLTDEEVTRIASRTDEALRRRLMNI